MNYSNKCVHRSTDQTNNTHRNLCMFTRNELIKIRHIWITIEVNKVPNKNKYLSLACVAIPHTVNVFQIYYFVLYCSVLCLRG